MTSEWLLTNGVVWTGTEEVRAIAIRGDRIIAIGSEDVEVLRRFRTLLARPARYG